jgi:hypothetical protein
MSKQAGQMVAMVLLGRDLAHRAHWKTASYSEHKALEAFYENVLGVLDTFVESWQGQYGELLDVPLADNEFEGEMADVLEQQMAWIQDNREKVVPGGETSLLNTLDTIVSIYQTTLYKLRFLS